jgi:NAD-dependent SIR2 family protein deacetylase
MDDLERAAAAIAKAKTLLLTAGAGMGVDSGLPDFRGDEGFWKAYPPFRKLGLGFMDLANPGWFRDDPELAWGFYGHRLELYRRTEPHRGFQVLGRFAERAQSIFVFTSNVDGHFQKAGFAEDAVHECHGSIHHLQCLDGCGVGIFPATGGVTVDPTTFRARPPLPSCPACGALARPNILMFGDWGWDDTRTGEQALRFEHFLETAPAGACVIECGAGRAIPTVRRASERAARRLAGTLVRINLREPETPPGHIGLRMGALEALTRIDALVARSGAKATGLSARGNHGKGPST